MKYTRDQLADIANIMFIGAIDRIESMLPPSVPVGQGITDNELRTVVLNAVEVVGMQLSILYANQTGDGVSVHEVEGITQFEQMLYDLIKERQDPNWVGFEDMDSCNPDCSHLAAKYADWCVSVENYNPSPSKVSLESYLAPSSKELVNCVAEGVKAHMEGQTLANNPYLHDDRNSTKMWRESKMKAWEAGYFRNMPAILSGGKRI